MSLIISMTLRFVPKFASQLKVVTNAQRCMGRDVSNGSIIKRAKNGLNILSIMTTWSLENAIETADSMKSRGYGIPGRTAFSIFTFDRPCATATWGTHRGKPADTCQSAAYPHAIRKTMQSNTEKHKQEKVFPKYSPPFCISASKLRL